MKIRRYEQSAFALRTIGGIRVAVDFGQEVLADTISAHGAIHAAFVSHQHPDHLHPPHLLAFAAPVYAPKDVVDRLESSDLDIETVTADSNVRIGDLSVTFFNSDHGPNLSAPIDNLGMAFLSHGKRVLFLGDMAVASEVPNASWDAVLVPVGGSKVFTPEAAANYVRHLGHTGVVIPVHYHGRADRTSGEQFRTHAASFCDVRLLDVGAEVDL